MKYLIILLLLSVISLKAQTIRLVYKTTSTEAAERIVENYHLDIDTKAQNATYYNRVYFVNDSIFKKSGEFGYTGFKMTDFVKTNLLESKYSEEYKILNMDVFKIRMENPQNWEITKDTTIWENKVLQKATTNYGGRHWEAWFDASLPIHIGPYYFNGLPGLIVKLNDSENNFSFELIKLQNLPEPQTIDFIGTLQNNAVPITLDKWKKLMLQSYKDPLGYIAKGLSDSDKPIRLEDGTLLTKQNLKSSEEIIRNRLRKQNPIHLDFKVSYPKQ